MSSPWHSSNVVYDESYMKQRSTDPKLVAEHDAAWKALKDHPLDMEIEKLFERLRDLQTWDPCCQTLAEHQARYEAGKPAELWAEIQRLRFELHNTPEMQRWFKSYQKLYEWFPQPVGTTSITKSPITQYEIKVYHFCKVCGPRSETATETLEQRTEEKRTEKI